MPSSRRRRPDGRATRPRARRLAPPAPASTVASPARRPPRRSAARSSVANSSRSARDIFCSRSTMCTGIRIVRALFATPRCTAWRIHQVAYVENLNPFRQSNFSAARIKPMIPSWIRSSSISPCPWYLFAIETTRRRFELTRRSFAVLSPSSIRFASSTSCAAVSSGKRPASLRNSCSESVVAAAIWVFVYETSSSIAREQSSVSSIRASRAVRAAPPCRRHRARPSTRARAARSCGRSRALPHARGGWRSGRRSSPSATPVAATVTAGDR